MDNFDHAPTAPNAHKTPNPAESNPHPSLPKAMRAENAVQERQQRYSHKTHLDLFLLPEVILELVRPGVMQRIRVGTPVQA